MDDKIYRENLHKLFLQAQFLYDYKGNEAKIFSFLENNEERKRRGLIDFKTLQKDYEHQTLNSDRLRYKILESLIHGNKITPRSIEQLKEEVISEMSIKEKGNIDIDAFRRWAASSILFPFLLFVNQDERDTVPSIAVDIMEELGLTGKTTRFEVFGFADSRDAGSISTGFKLFNASHKKNNTAKQFQLKIDRTGLRVGVYNGLKKSYDFEYKIELETFTLKGIIDFSYSHKNIILEDKYEEKPELKSNKKKEPPELKEETKVRKENIIEDTPTITFDRKRKQKLYKLSHGKDFSPREQQQMLDKKIAVVHSNTKAKGVSKESQADTFRKAQIGDWFYLTHGNDGIQLIGEFTNDVENCEIPELRKIGFIQRRYVVKKTSTNTNKYKGEQKWWTPNNLSTFIEIKRSAFSKANEGIFQPFFELKIESIDDKFILLDLIGEEVHQSKTAVLHSDDLESPDYLGIDKDITAFAKLISADAFQPPLAIALFGKWGKGKSYFMTKLQFKIDQLTNSHEKDENEKLIYKEGVTHIHFNAWSYLDANLWAGLVTKIFEGLDNYISGTNVIEGKREEFRNNLGNELSLIKERKNSIENEKIRLSEYVRKIEEKKETVKDKITSLEEDLKNTQIDIRKKSLLFISYAMLTEMHGKINNLVLEDDEISITELNDKIRSSRYFIKQFLNEGRWIRSIILLIAILFIGFISLIFIEKIPSIDQYILEFGTSLTVIGILMKRFHDTQNKIFPIIEKITSYKNKAEIDVEIQKSELIQIENNLQLQIKLKQEKLSSLDSEIRASQLKVDELEFKSKSALSTHSLNSFISQKAKGDDYQKYLGIVSIIRNDFEMISKLFADSNDEQNLSKSDKELKKKFKSYFKKPLQRIVLYIDDLDRCKEDKVLEVLEAVNLLMAFPLFVVVVGVDQRWVKNALLKEYQFQFGQLKKEKDEKNEYQPIETINFLEKIFQIPFHLRDAEEVSIKRMISNLTDSHLERVVEKTKIKPQHNDPDEPVDSFESPTESFNSSDKKIEIVPFLKLSKREQDEMKSLSSIVGNNPRAIKRFVNTYLLIRSHEEIDLKIEERFGAMLFLALPLGRYKNICKAYINALNHLIVFSAEERVIEETQNEELREVYDELEHQLKLDKVSNEVLDVLKKFEKNIHVYKHIRRFLFDMFDEEKEFEEYCLKIGE